MTTLPDDLKLGNNVWLSAYGPHNWGYTAQITPEQTELVIPRGKATGGSSAVNGQVMFRGIPEDYDRWAEWGNDEWGFTGVLPYFNKLETDLDFGGDDFHGTTGPVPVRRSPRSEWMPHALAFERACLDLGFKVSEDQNHPESTGISPRARNTIDGVRMSMALTYLEQARHRLNLTVRGGVTARRILFEGKRAVGVEAESGGEVFTVEGDQIVVSGGAIGSPHLLLLSGVGPAEHISSFGIDVVHDLPGVGQNLRDHPSAAVLYMAAGEKPDVQAPVIQVGLRYTVEGSDLRNDMQLSPMLMTSEHRPAQVEINDDLNYIGMSASLQLALGKGGVDLAVRRPPRAAPAELQLLPGSGRPAADAGGHQAGGAGCRATLLRRHAAGTDYAHRRGTGIGRPAGRLAPAQFGHFPPRIGYLQDGAGLGPHGGG